MAKRFEQFINELNLEDHPKLWYWEIENEVKKIIDNALKAIEVGDEQTTVSGASSGENIPGIGTRKDYEDENGVPTHIIIGVRLFINNSKFREAFNSFAELGQHLIKVEETIRSLFKIEKTGVLSDYYCYLIKIDDDLKNLVKSKKGLNKFNA